jgi:hypothetical protein
MRGHGVAGMLSWVGGTFRAALPLSAFLTVCSAFAAFLPTSSAAQISPTGPSIQTDRRIQIDRPTEDGRARLRIYGTVEVVAPPGKDQTTLAAEANSCLVPGGIGGIDLNCMQNKFGDTVILPNGTTLGAAPNYPALPSRQQPTIDPGPRNLSNSIGNGSDDPADRDLRTYFVTKSLDDRLRLLAQIDAEANAPGTYRNNPRFWRQHQEAVEDARLFLGEYAESQGNYVSARSWYQKAMAVTDTSTQMATTKLANLYKNGLGGPRDGQQYEELMAVSGAITPAAQARRQAEAAAAAAASDRASQAEPRYLESHPDGARKQCLASCSTNATYCENNNSFNNTMGIATGGLSLGTLMRNSMQNSDCYGEQRTCVARCNR